MQTTEPVAELASGVEAPKPPTLAQCHEVIDTLVQWVAEQQREIASLHERVTLNSKTSSKPPSSDGPGSPKRAQRRASPRKRGAQKGHPGSSRVGGRIPGRPDRRLPRPASLRMRRPGDARG